MSEKPVTRRDQQRLQRLFNRKAADFDRHGWLHREVASRLLEHLEPVALEPKNVLELGSATGECGRELTRRYRSARVYSLDFASQMLFQARTKTSRWFNRQVFVCAAAEQLCFADHSQQLVCGNLLLPWIEDPTRLLREAHRVLEAGGLLMMSNFGPQTLHELREAFSQVDSAAHVNAFMDMHDLGDALTSTGFRDVVVDAERLNVSYRTVGALLRELQEMGVGNANPLRRRGLMGRESLAKLRRAFEENSEDNQYYLSFELIFAHGWKPQRSANPVEVRWPDQE